MPHGSWSAGEFPTMAVSLERFRKISLPRLSGLMRHAGPE